MVGPKGTGKSTLAKLVAEKLGKNLDVKTIHLGKPPASWLSFLPRLFVPTVRKALPDERLSEYEKPERRAERRYSSVFVIGKLLVAHDRRRLLTRSMREMSSGTIVISDRCPATNATGLDGSAFDDLAITQARSPFQRWLMEQERSIYRRLPKPRLVLKLSVPIATALKRDLARCKPGDQIPMLSCAGGRSKAKPSSQNLSFARSTPTVNSRKPCGKQLRACGNRSDRMSNCCPRLRMSIHLSP